jgi:hypothetical protein
MELAVLDVSAVLAFGAQPHATISPHDSARRFQIGSRWFVAHKAERVANSSLPSVSPLVCFGHTGTLSAVICPAAFSRPHMRGEEHWRPSAYLVPVTTALRRRSAGRFFGPPQTRSACACSSPRSPFRYRPASTDQVLWVTVPWIFSCGDIQRPPAPSGQHFAQSRFAPRVTHLAVGSDVPLGPCCTQAVLLFLPRGGIDCWGEGMDHLKAPT